MYLKVLSQTDTSLISIDRLKEQCYIPQSVSDFDSLIYDLYLSAVEYAQGRTWRQLHPAVLLQKQESFGDSIQLIRLPATEVDSVKYFIDDEEKTLHSDKYRFDDVNGVIYPVDAFPETDERFDAVKVQYKAGNGITHDVKLAILMMVKYWFDHRDAILASGSSKVDTVDPPLGATTLLDGASLRVFV